MRHQADNMLYRQERLDDMRELFRQFMSMLILEKTQLEQQNIYLDTDISFTEINKYFFSGCACAFFQIATYTYTDLRFNPDEWSED
jgi:single-stranded DNA-specific DHH superfamily exonuclease